MDYRDDHLAELGHQLAEAKLRLADARYGTFSRDRWEHRVRRLSHAYNMLSNQLYAEEKLYAERELYV
jgi:hypothetical protein